MDFEKINADDTLNQGRIKINNILDAVESQASELKSELKSDLNDLIDDIFNTVNILLTSEHHKGMYWAGQSNKNDKYDYFVVNVTAGNKYAFSEIRFLYHEDGTAIFNSYGKYIYEATKTEKLYVTYSTEDSNWYAYEFKNYITNFDIGTYQKPHFSKNLLSIINENVDRIKNIFINDLNLYLSSKLVNNYYWAESQANPNTDYSYFIVPVQSGKTYVISQSRFLYHADGTLIKDNTPNRHSFIADRDEYVYVTVYNDCVNNNEWYMFCSDVVQDETLVGTYQHPSFKKSVTDMISNNASFKNVSFKTVKGNLTNGAVLEHPITNVKKNNVYAFNGKITSFDSIVIGHGKTQYASSYITITGSKLIVTTYYTNKQDIEFEHGLTISDYLDVVIKVGKGKAKIYILSNGKRFVSQDVNWDGCSHATTYVESINTVMSDCVFTWSSDDINKDVWAFGDSYFSFTSNARWPYYLEEMGYLDNVLLNAFPGENSNQAYNALLNLINTYGKPKKLLWALGMNDGGDTSTVSSNYMTNINKVISLCKNKNIELILCTIPTVPTINHEKKNEFVRNSGYRYVDFAKAVGSNADGLWYSDMLSNDGVHPTDKGAIALCYKAICDCPEITFAN